MRWSHTAVTASCAANGQTDRPKLKLVPFDWHADARKKMHCRPLRLAETPTSIVANRRQVAQFFLTLGRQLDAPA